jgi:hypothetical protein
LPCAWEWCSGIDRWRPIAVWGSIRGGDSMTVFPKAGESAVPLQDEMNRQAAADRQIAEHISFINHFLRDCVFLKECMGRDPSPYHPPDWITPPSCPPLQTPVRRCTPVSPTLPKSP